MPELNTELIVPGLINGAIFATVAVIVPAFLLSRFTREIIGRSVLVFFLFIAPGAYFGFVTLGREVVDTQPIWTLGCVCKLRASNKTSAQSLKSLDKGLEEPLGDEP